MRDRAGTRFDELARALDQISALGAPPSADVLTPVTLKDYL